MFKILLALILISTPAWATQWRGGTGENTILGSSNAADIDYNSYNSIVKPLDNLLSTYCNEYLTYSSSTTIKVMAGSCVVSNSQGTIRLFLQDTGTSNLTSSNLDTGSSFSSNTTYYIYSTASTNSSTSSTYYISTSNTSPSGQTYYYMIGYFYSDSNSNITDIHNNYSCDSQLGTWSSKSNNTVYNSLTDGFVTAYTNSSGGVSLVGLTDSSNPPTTNRSNCNTSSSGDRCSITIPVKRGDYWKVTGAEAVNFIPIGK